MVKNELAAGLRQLYVSDLVAHRLLDHFAARQNDSRITPAARAAALVGASLGEIFRVFRRLEQLGAGRFIVGRRGAKTRMEWRLSIRGLGLAAQGAAADPEPIDPEQVDDSDFELSETDVPMTEVVAESDWIAHAFQLRPDLRVTIKLPANLTSREAERLAGFIRQVPFDE